jgi:hypothetical protein
MWKETSNILTGVNERIHGIPLSGESAFRPRIEPNSSQIGVQCVRYTNPHSDKRSNKNAIRLRLFPFKNEHPVYTEAYIRRTFTHEWEKILFVYLTGKLYEIFFRDIFEEFSRPLLEK